MKSIQECIDFEKKLLDDIDLDSYTGDADRYYDDEGLSVLWILKLEKFIEDQLVE